MSPFALNLKFPFNLPKWLQHVIIMLLLFAVVIGVGYLLFKLMPSTGPLDDIKKEYEERLEQELARDREKLGELEDELANIKYEQELLWEEIQRSVREREEAHEAIDAASTIDDIDAVLRRGGSGRTGNR